MRVFTASVCGLISRGPRVVYWPNDYGIDYSWLCQTKYLLFEFVDNVSSALDSHLLFQFACVCFAFQLPLNLLNNFPIFTGGGHSDRAMAGSGSAILLHACTVNTCNVGGRKIRTTDRPSVVREILSESSQLWRRIAFEDRS